jgi:chromosome segregation ATPase
MNIVIAVVVGIIIGYLAEWAVDVFILRRKTRELEGEISDLEGQRADMESRHDALADENQNLKDALLQITGEVYEPQVDLEADQVAVDELPAGEDAPIRLPDFIEDVDAEIDHGAAEASASAVAEADVESEWVPEISEGTVDSGAAAPDEDLQADEVVSDAQDVVDQGMDVDFETPDEGDQVQEVSDEVSDAGGEVQETGEEVQDSSDETYTGEQPVE